MCGIIAITNSSDAPAQLLEGLQLLEYRGYDSAGLAVHTGFDVVRVRAVGPVVNLLSVVSTRSDLSSGSVGIAHTRWATHGGVTEANAHPHTDPTESVFVVHNGIIENSTVLKSSLPGPFSSETDTEVIAHLIAHEIAAGKANLEALKQATQKLKGQYGVAVVFKNDPESVYVATNGSPMLVGKTATGFVIASDERALIGATEYAVIPDAACGVFNRTTTFDLAFAPSKPQEAINHKATFPHFFAKEAAEIPQAIAAALAGRLTPTGVRIEELAHLEMSVRNATLVRIVGCGTALYAGMVSKNMLHALLKIPVEVESASEFRRRYYVPQPGEIVIALSQSGETADTVGAIEKAKEFGVKTIAIVNVEQSTLARKADAVIPCRAGREVSVASTKACMSHGVILALIGIQYAKNITVARSVAASITTLSENAKKSLFHVREIDTIVQWLATAEHVFTIGRLSNLGAAREAALKLKEVCYIHAESQEAGELKHGSLALIDETFPTIAFLSDSPAGEKTLSAIQEIQARNGEVLAVGPKKIVERSNATHNIIVPQVHPFLQALINVVPIYQLTYQIALVKQLPIDKPRNLAKAVTVE